ncbi:hypothetical protein CTAM01_05442, partial [Colletotrichum tamarilloi]
FFQVWSQVPWRDPSEKSAQHRVLPGIPQPSPLASCRKTPPPSIGLLFHPRALHTLRLALSVGCEGIRPRFC